MKRYVLALLLLVGCVKGTPPVIIKPLPVPTAETVKADLDRAEMVLSSLRATSGIVCALAGQGTDVCLTIDHTLDILGFSLSHAQALFDQFQKGGLDVVLVSQAVQAFFDGLEAFGNSSQLARMMVGHGTDHPVAVAYCSRCCGVVVDPAKQAAARSSPKPPAATKAP